MLSISWGLALPCIGLHRLELPCIALRCFALPHHWEHVLELDGTLLADITGKIRHFYRTPAPIQISLTTISPSAYPNEEKTQVKKSDIASSSGKQDLPARRFQVLARRYIVPACQGGPGSSAARKPRSQELFDTEPTLEQKDLQLSIRNLFHVS